MGFEASGVMAELFQKLYGGLAGYQETLPAVGTTRIKVLNNNPERTSIVFVNPSADFITLTPTTRIPSGSGIRIAPNGGLVSVTIPDDAPLPSMAWFAVGDAAALTLYILETMRVSKIEDEGE